VETIVVGSAWVRAGHTAILTEDVAAVLGRPPASFQTWVDQHRKPWSGGAGPRREHVTTELCARVAWMRGDGDGVHLGRYEPSLQLVGEHQIGQFRLEIGVLEPVTVFVM